jgi:hypothetical protein
LKPDQDLTAEESRSHFVTHFAAMKQLAKLAIGLTEDTHSVEVADAGVLSAALLPWMRAERVLALPRGRPGQHVKRLPSGAIDRFGRHRFLQQRR